MNDLCRLKKVSGIIFNIQYFCINDGPGIRTAVFLKGCSLSCLWCHNPEGIPERRLLSFAWNKCILCGECAKICPEAHAFDNGRHDIFREKCPDELLDRSADVCPTKALAVVGSNVSAGEVLAKITRDRNFYAESGGGVTFSGGEPTMQKEFLFALLRLASHEGIHTALETSGFCDFEYYESILPYVDLFLLDFKEVNPQKHMEFTKVDNKLIMENIGRLHDAGAKILLRCPIIPGLNDRDEHFEGIARMTAIYPNLLGAEIMPYHRLASAKADRMGLDLQEEYVQPSSGTVEAWREKVRSFGGRVVQM